MKTDEEAASLTESLKTMVGVDGSDNRPVTMAPVLLLDVQQWVSAKDSQEALVATRAVAEGAPLPTVNFRPAPRGLSGNIVASLMLPVAAAMEINEAEGLQFRWS